ncbi:MAG: DUF4258 domain-containing protein [Chloroflexi bacterium]|nr:DUF4258 domain-containing protein [Chloroflexota bacterium]
MQYGECLNAASLLPISAALEQGKIIEEYPDDTPYPSCLILGWSGHRPLHVVVASNAKTLETIIVTVYQPDLAYWESGFERRKPL